MSPTISKIWSRQGQWKSEDHWKRRCLKEVEELQDLELNVKFNKKQCANLISELSGTVEEMIKLSNAPSNSNFGRILKDLFRVVMKVKLLVEGNAKENWLAIAINMESQEAFKELLLEMRICFISACHLANGYPWRPITTLTFDSEDMSDDRRLFKKQIEQALQDSSPERREEATYLKNKLKAAGYSPLFVPKDTWSLPPERGAALGGGAFGMVSAMEWRGEKYAIKFLSDEAGFRKEASILARLNHPNIVKLLHCGAKDEGEQVSYYIAMEIGQTDLGAVLTERNRMGIPLTYPAAIDIIFQIARGMRYLHENQVAHFDLKPSNILVTEMHDEDLHGYFNVKIIDFFISESDVGNDEMESTWKNRKNLGTTKYMAPEVFGINPGMVVPFKADVYSYAMTCYEILSGKVPFEGICRRRVIHDLVSNGKRPEFPECYSKTLVKLINKCWATDPAERPTFGNICTTLAKVQVGFLIKLKKNMDASLIPVPDPCDRSLTFSFGMTKMRSGSILYCGSSSFKKRYGAQSKICLLKRVVEWIYKLGNNK